MLRFLVVAGVVALSSSQHASAFTAAPVSVQASLFASTSSSWRRVGLRMAKIDSAPEVNIVVEQSLHTITQTHFHILTNRDRV